TNEQDDRPSRIQEIQRVAKELDQEATKHTEALRRRSATRWLEKGERNNRYFYQVIKTRNTQQTMSAIKTGTDRVTSTPEMMKIATTFYRNLYTPEEVSDRHLAFLSRRVRRNRRVPKRDRETLTENPTEADLELILAHVPKYKSPGLDGLTFELYQ